MRSGINLDLLREMCRNLKKINLKTKELDGFYSFKFAALKTELIKRHPVFLTSREFSLMSCEFVEFSPTSRECCGIFSDVM